MEDLSGFPRGKDLHNQIQGLHGLAKALVGRDNAEDLLSRIYVKITERPPDSVEDIRGWLARVLRNEAIDVSRSDGRRREREERWGQSSPIAAPPEILAQSEARQALKDAMEEVDASSQVVLKLRYYEGKTPVEIAGELGITVVNARVRLTRALSALRLTMKRKYGRAWSGMCISIAFPRLGASTAQTTSLARIILLGSSGTLGLFALALLLIWVFSEPDLIMQSGYEAAGGPEALKASRQALTPSVEVGAEARSEQQLHQTAEVGLITIEDEQGGRVQALRPIVFAGGRTIFAKPLNGKAGQFSLGVPLGTLLEEDEESKVLVSSFGWAPALVSLNSVVAAGGLIRLNSEYEVSGVVEVPQEFLGNDLFLSLNLKATRPAPGDERFDFRTGLTSKQQRIFDRKFADCTTEISNDGKFIFRGLERGWSGALRFMDSRLRLIASDERGSFQEINLPRPKSDLRLALEVKPDIRVKFLPQVGSKMLEEIELSQIVDLSGNLVSNAVFPDSGHNEFIIYCDEYPQQEILAELRQFGLAGELALIRGNGGGWNFFCRPPSAYQPKFRVVGDNGRPLQGIDVFADGDPFAVTNAEGTVEETVPGFVGEFQINDPSWLPAKWKPSQSHQEVMLERVAGLEVELAWANEAGVDRPFEVELITSNGINELPSVKGGNVGWQEEWRVVFGGGVGTHCQVLKANAQVGVPKTYFGEMQPGKVTARVTANGQVVGESEILIGEHDKFRRFQIPVSTVSLANVKGVVRLPNGEPAGGARIYLANDTDLRFLALANDYGEFRVEGVPHESRLIARKYGYQASNSLQVGPLSEQICNLEVKIGRCIELELKAHQDWNEIGPIYFRVVRSVDGLSVLNGSIQGKATKVYGIPLSDCVLYLWGEGWSLCREIPIDENSIRIPDNPLTDLRVVLVPESIEVGLLGNAMFETPLGIWRTSVRWSNEEEKELEFKVLPSIEENLIWMPLVNQLTGERGAYTLTIHTTDSGHSIGRVSVDKID